VYMIFIEITCVLATIYKNKKIFL